MSSAYSRKHWRQRLRPYLRIRPVRWVQTRLKAGVEGARVSRPPIRVRPRSASAGSDRRRQPPRRAAIAGAHAPRCIQPAASAQDDEKKCGRRTIRASPCQSCVGASTRRQSEPWWWCEDGLGSDAVTKKFDQGRPGPGPLGARNINYLRLHLARWCGTISFALLCTIVSVPLPLLSHIHLL